MNTKKTIFGWAFLVYLLNYLFRCMCKGKILIGTASKQNLRILSSCAAQLTAWYFPNPLFIHPFLHSAAAEFVRTSTPHLHFTREFLDTTDGGTICLSWARLSTPVLPTEVDVCLFVLPGTNGDENASWYLHKSCAHALELGWKVVVYIRRGCGIPYTSGRPQDYADPLKENGDMTIAIDRVQQFLPTHKLVGLSYSLGGNFLANFLGNKSKKCSQRFLTCVCICSPFDITGLSYWIEHKYKLVDWFLRNTKAHWVRLNRSVIESDVELKHRGIDVDEICNAKSFRKQCELDNLKVWGLPQETLNQYLDRTSCVNQLPNIVCPTLFVNSLDDPVVDGLFLAKEQVMSNPNLCMVTTKTGGHHAYLDAFLYTSQLPHCDKLAFAWILAALQVVREEEAVL
jgi:predicted alpha/beta-fold hydrolase